MRRAGCLLLVIVGAVLIAALTWRAGKRPLDLGAPAERRTGPALVALGGDFPACRALLSRAGARFEALAPRRDGPHCGYADAVRFIPGGARRIAFAPANVGVACPIAAALAAWEWTVVQPAALKHFGRPVVSIEHLGSYNCRRIYGRDQGSWSEHATADAIDIAAFRLQGGRRVAVIKDWRGPGEAARFLREVRTGACPLFATVLSPDYNAAHRDHLHLDQARRGGWGWRACH